MTTNSNPVIQFKERPILFSGEMVRAILDGRKTQTRRVVKGLNACDSCVHADNAPNNTPDLVDDDGKPNVAGAIFGTDPYLKTGFCTHNNVCGERIRCPYGKPGDRLWVRETFSSTQAEIVMSSTSARPVGSSMGMIAYRATVGTDKAPFGKWRPSIFMPRALSRINLEITNVRVERLQDISEADAESEGLLDEDGAYCEEFGLDSTWTSCRDLFRLTWDEINGKKHPWSANPFVWVIEFKKI